MRLSRTKNARKNIIMGLFNQCVSIILPFLVRTVFIHTLGAEYLGLNGLFTSILNLLSITEMGFGTAAVFCMYKPIAENDTERICALLYFYRKVYFFIGLIVFILGSSLIPVLPLLIKGDVPSNINIYLLYIVYLVNSVLGYWLYAYKSLLLNAFQRGDVVFFQGIIARLVVNTLQIFTLIIFKNYYLYIISTLLYTIINNLLIARKVDSLFPYYICKGSISNEDKNVIKIKLSGLMIDKICAMSRNTLDNICISMFLGLVETTIYDNYYFVMTCINNITTLVPAALLAGIGNSIVLDSQRKNYEEQRILNNIYMSISGWCAICLYNLYQPFMLIWVGKDLLMNHSSMILMCVYFYSLKIGDIRAMYSSAAGLWWENRYRAIFEAVANIVLNIILVRFWGMTGIIVATLIPLLIINFGLGSRIIFRYYFVDEKVSEYYLMHFRFFLETIIVGLCTSLICNQIHLYGIMKLLANGIVCIVIPLFMFMIIKKSNPYHRDSIDLIWNFLKLDKYPSLSNLKRILYR